MAKKFGKTIQYNTPYQPTVTSLFRNVTFQHSNNGNFDKTGY